MRRQQALTTSTGPTAQVATSRRGFLRRAGITGAAVAGMIGLADIAGLSPALAGSQSVRRYKLSGGSIRPLTSAIHDEANEPQIMPLSCVDSRKPAHEAAPVGCGSNEALPQLRGSP